MALKKDLSNVNGINTTYHRINAIEIDYDKNVCTLKISNYTDKNYRNEEKKFEEDYENSKERFFELHNKFINGTLTDNEKEEYAKTDISLIENNKMNFESRIVDNIKIDLNLDFDIRDKLYQLLKKTETFINSTDI